MARGLTRCCQGDIKLTVRNLNTIHDRSKWLRTGRTEFCSDDEAPVWNCVKGSFFLRNASTMDATPGQ